VVSLIDTSVWGWRHRSEAVDGEIARLARRHLAATCHPLMLELLYSTPNAEAFRVARQGLEAQLVLPVGPREWARALDVYERLAEKGGSHHRSVQHTDLLAAAAAESAGAEVLHYDEDFDRIAEVTGQPTRWVAERGSLG
jgi:predicted nucleic acid-binding protein